MLVLFGLAMPDVPAQSPAASHKDSRAQQFDAVFQRVIGPESMDIPREEYDTHLERLRALLPPGDRARDAQFRSVYCGSERLKDYRQALAYSSDAEQRAKATGDRTSQVRAMFCKSLYIELLDGSAQALAELEQAVALLEGTQETQLRAELRMQMGFLRSDLGEQAKAMMDLQRARVGFRDAGITRDVEALTLRLAMVYRRLGDWAQAESHFKSTLQNVLDKDNWRRAVIIQTQLGYLYDDAGDLQKSMDAFERAVAMSLKHAGNPGIANARLGLATAQIAQGQTKAALATLALAKADYEAAVGSASDKMFHLLTGQALASSGDHAAALKHYATARPQLEEEGNPRHLATLYKAQAASKEALGQQAAALKDFKRYTQLQIDLQTKMRLEASRLMEYDLELHRRDLENKSLRAEADARQQQVTSLQRERQWQLLALALGVVVLLMLAGLAWRQLRNARALRMLAMTDPLTGLMSRRAIDAALSRQRDHGAKTKQPLTVLMLDLDHFKQVNDTYGHAAGDAVLRNAAAAWKTQLRDQDLLGRMGGEEFMAICPNTDQGQAATIALRLLEATRSLTFADVAPSLRMTVSIGGAQLQPNEAVAELVARADAALYRAKKSGRNRYVD